MTAAASRPDWLRRPENLHRLARGVLVLVFLWLAGRYWHPYYGFTAFLQFDDSAAAVMLPELRDTPVYVHHNTGGYDGLYYAQMAVHPALRDPAMAPAMDSLPYRARRILLCWLAYAAGAGDPWHVVQAYAAMNVVLWLGLAWLLAKIFPPDGWRNQVAWIGLMFSAGVLHSVRFALTDLAALLLVAAAVWLGERRRGTFAATLVGAAGLVRETAVLAAVSLWPADWRKISGATLARCVLAVLPLALWLAYLVKFVGPMTSGGGNFNWPLAGFAGKWVQAFSDLHDIPETWLALTTLLALAGLTVQLVYLSFRRQVSDHWWRLGAAYGVLLLCLGPLVWEGHPGAYTRVLLPLALAFNVLAVRGRAGLGWLLGGNLSVFSGLFILWLVPHGSRELATGRVAAGAYVVQSDDQWYPAEHGRDRIWAWCPLAGGVSLELWPRNSATLNLQVAVRGITARPLEIRQAGRLLWQGEIGTGLQWIALPAISVSAGRAHLEFSSPTAPVRESTSDGARSLGFAVYGVRVD